MSRIPPSPGSRDALEVAPRWRWHHQVLQELRDRLLDERDTELGEAREALEPHSLDAADSASDEFDHDLALAFLSQHQDALVEVNAALRRLADGTYGVCEETGEPIPEDRLRAVPWTRHLREVAERHEREGHSVHTRLPGAASIQGPPPGGLSQAAEPEDEYSQARERERFLRTGARRAIEQGEEEVASLPEVPSDSGEMSESSNERDR